MDAPAYDKLLGLLASAKLTLASNAGDLTPADLRIRCLVNITAKEAQRALLETSANSRVRPSNNAAGSAAGETADPRALDAESACSL